jgi:hypothetical protein
MLAGVGDMLAGVMDSQIEALARVTATGLTTRRMFYIDGDRQMVRELDGTAHEADPNDPELIAAVARIRGYLQADADDRDDLVKALSEIEPTRTDVCLDCPTWAWEENGPTGVYGPETHPRAFGDGETHTWRPAMVIARLRSD